MRLSHSRTYYFLSAQDLSLAYGCLKLGVGTQRPEALWERKLCFSFSLVLRAGKAAHAARRISCCGLGGGTAKAAGDCTDCPVELLSMQVEGDLEIWSSLEVLKNPSVVQSHQ